MTKFWELTASCIYDTIKRSKINPKNIAGVGVTGNMVGLWPIDKKISL